MMLLLAALSTMPTPDQSMLRVPENTFESGQCQNLLGERGIDRIAGASVQLAESRNTRSRLLVKDARRRNGHI